MRSFLPCAVVMATAATIAYAGVARVQNNCPDTVYLVSDGGQDEIPVHTVPAGAQYTEAYYSKASGGGPSIKIWRGSSEGPGGQNITQFEYEDGRSAIFPWRSYDISNVNCYNTGDPSGASCPFWEEGFVLVSSATECWNVPCPPGEQNCPYAYWWPDDNQISTRKVQYSCTDMTADLTMYLCPCSGPSSDACAAAKAQGWTQQQQTPTASNSTTATPAVSARSPREARSPQHTCACDVFSRRGLSDSSSQQLKNRNIELELELELLKQRVESLKREVMREA